MKRDGTVVATGNNYYRQCNVTDWKDILAISACGTFTVGLKSDGPVAEKKDPVMMAMLQQKIMHGVLIAEPSDLVHHQSDLIRNLMKPDTQSDLKKVYLFVKVQSMNKNQNRTDNNIQVHQLRPYLTISRLS